MRTEGIVAASILSSIHVRCTDMEMACAPDDPDDKAQFEKNTRSMSLEAITYMASLDCQWGMYPNHHRISSESYRVLQVRHCCAWLCHRALDSCVIAPLIAIQLVDSSRF